MPAAQVTLPGPDAHIRARKPSDLRAVQPQEPSRQLLEAVGRAQVSSR